MERRVLKSYSVDSDDLDGSLDTVKELIGKNDKAKLELKSLLQLFLSTDGDFTIEYASNISHKIKQTWHQLATVVTAEWLNISREGMIRGSINVEFKYLRVFHAYGCMELAQGGT